VASVAVPPGSCSRVAITLAANRRFSKRLLGYRFEDGYSSSTLLPSLDLRMHHLECDCSRTTRKRGHVSAQRFTFVSSPATPRSTACTGGLMYQGLGASTKNSMVSTEVNFGMIWSKEGGSYRIGAEW